MSNPRTPPAQWQQGTAIGRVLVALLLTELVSACGGGSGGGSLPSAQPTTSASSQAAVPLVPTVVTTGHYVGAVTIANVTYFGDAVFTQDGAVRLYVGGPYDPDGVLQDTRPESSEQFVGTIEMHDRQWSGTGLILGEECAINAASRFCGQPAPAEISATVQVKGSLNVGLQGQMQVTTSSGTETWQLALQRWPDQPVTAVIPGQLHEMLAEFASAGDVIVSFDSSGRWFFQSATSGCVGNGTSVARPDGTAGTFDITLVIENCNAAYAYLNGQYEGLALYTASSYWDYDSLLRMWLSKPTGETPPAALTTLGS